MRDPKCTMRSHYIQHVADGQCTHACRMFILCYILRVFILACQTWQKEARQRKLKTHVASIVVCCTHVNQFWYVCDVNHIATCTRSSYFSMCNTESWVWPGDEAIELPQTSYFMLQANVQSTCTNCKHWIELKPFKPVQHLLSSMTSIIVLRANDISAHPIYSLQCIG